MQLHQESVEMSEFKHKLFLTSAWLLKVPGCPPGAASLPQWANGSSEIGPITDVAFQKSPSSQVPLSHGLYQKDEHRFSEKHLGPSSHSSELINLIRALTFFSPSLLISVKHIAAFRDS